MACRYLLQREDIHNHDQHGASSHNTVASFETLEEAVLAMNAYINDEYGPDLDDVFESVTTYCDGGAMVEAVDHEGDEIRLWIQKVSDRPARPRAQG
jgi:hypothetical protein